MWMTRKGAAVHAVTMVWSTVSFIHLMAKSILQGEDGCCFESDHESVSANVCEWGGPESMIRMGLQRI